ncbi:MAG: type II toxin-antitoxin system VapC family toxin, partial [Burkholderiales bacterium]
MILLDANLLIYAIDADSPHHKPARRWLEKTLSSGTRVGLPWIVVLAFVRITTRSGILRHPLAIAQAAGFIDDWLAQPYVTFIGPSDGHWPILKNLLVAGGAAGNLTSDAHLAALAIEHGYEIASSDNDFRRFTGVTLVNP